MSAPDRRALVDRNHSGLSVRRQCQLLSVTRSGFYRPPPAANDDDDLALMRRIDELFTAWPFLGSRRMTAMLRAEGRAINRKRVQRLMRKMGIAALGPRPRTTKPAPGHKIFPYLLRGHAIEQPNQVWCADITYIPLPRGFLYLVAVMDWASRAVLAWAAVEHHGHVVLRLGARGGACPLRPTRDFQHRPGQPVHQRGLHRHAGGSRHSHLDGRPRALDGQRLHRAAVAFAQT
jgi:transposase InsO family protein